MSIRIKIDEVVIEKVANGKNRYEKAAVKHTANGQSREQKIMSFTNPAVFKLVQNMKPGEEYDVTITKNDAGFNQWAQVVRATDVGDESVTTPRTVPAPAARQNVSTYETADERKIKQLYIIRQSSISNAIEFHSRDPQPTIGDVLSTAQEFVDFVYGRGESLETMDSDIGEVS